MSVIDKSIDSFRNTLIQDHYDNFAKIPHKIIKFYNNSLIFQDDNEIKGNLYNSIFSNNFKFNNI